MITWITEQIITYTTPENTWTDVDISAYIPAGATGAIVMFEQATGSPVLFGMRKNGSTDNRTAQYSPANGNMGVLVGVDSNRIFEIYKRGPTMYLHILGYFSDEAVFFTNETQKTFNTSSFTDVNISADTGTDTAMAAIINAYGTTNYPTAGLRKNGSTDNRTGRILRSYQRSFIVGVDGSEIFEAVCSNSSYATFYLSGYIKDTANASFYTNALSVGDQGNNAWQDYTLPVGASGSFFEINHGTNPGIVLNIIKKGNTQRTTNITIYEHLNMYAECDINRKVSYYSLSSNYNNMMYLMGYSTAVSTFTPKFLTII